MVADPTPLTIENLVQLSSWCDILLTEGTTTTSGVPREPLRQGWREILNLSAPELRVLTTDLAGANTWARQAVQRNSAIAVISQEPDDRIVLMVDADEFLEVDAIRPLMSSIDKPVRLGLVPLYGAIDRTARRIHCCWKPEWPDLRRDQPERPYVVAGPSLATASMMRSHLPSHVRFRSPLVDREAHGIHVTMATTAASVSHKLANMRHEWHPRVLSELHLDTMLAAGVHHAGWWIANHREPELWLRALATRAGLRECGPLEPETHLRSLRAWSEARLSPDIPERIVESIDDYVSTRPVDAIDFLPELDNWLMSRPVSHTGHISVAADDHADE